MNLNDIQEIIIISDGCCYQNRNALLSSALLLMARTKNITITQKYLEKGHTQMECDSMHAAIERKLKKKEIYSPSGYVEVCKSARIHPFPYKVTELDHTFFKNFDILKTLSSIRPGKKAGDPVVNDIRCLRHSPDGISIKYKLSFSDRDYTAFPQRTRRSTTERSTEVLYQDLPQLYSSKQKISREKFNDLQKMKPQIPRDLHSFYDNILHE